jgi:hypothetical protein
MSIDKWFENLFTEEQAVKYGFRDKEHAESAMNLILSGYKKAMDADDKIPYGMAHLTALLAIQVAGRILSDLSAEWGKDKQKAMALEFITSMSQTAAEALGAEFRLKEVKSVPDKEGDGNGTVH